MLANTTTPVEETYADVKKLIYHIVNDFRAKHGGDSEELLAEANIGFMKAYQHFDHERGAKFSTFMHWVIWNHLLSFSTKSKLPVACADSVVDARPSPFLLWEFAEGLTEDAATVLDLVFSSPAELTAIAEGKGNQGRNWRSSIRDYLIQKGWGTNRILECFSEITAALS
jgi:RNA polymerase sigma factor (sigma-70 family)